MSAAKPREVNRRKRCPVTWETYDPDNYPKPGKIRCAGAAGHRGKTHNLFPEYFYPDERYEPRRKR